MSDRLEALLKQAIAAHLAGRLKAAADGYARVLSERPYEFRALHLGGAAAFQLERMEEAEHLLGRAARVMPNSGTTIMCLGMVCAAMGRDTEAEEHLKVGLALEPKNPEAWLNMGAFLVARGRNAEALGCFKKSLGLKPTYAPAFAGLGEVLKCDGQSAAAVAQFEMSVHFDPRNLTARLGLVQSLQRCNRIAESIAQCDRILAIDPRHVQARSSRLFLLNYLPDASRELVAEEHRRFGALFPEIPEPKFLNERRPNKRIRIAFLSPDLHVHAVAFFIEPILAHLDKAQFEVILYHDHPREDAVASRLRGHAGLWRCFAGKGDGFVEATIRADAPDVIVDLAGHSGQNRLQLFARRLAPVQITYLGYPNTTGLKTMDYRFTDPTADPADISAPFYSERLVPFSDCAWAYNPMPELFDPGPIPPAGSGSGIAFGSFNNLSKVNDPTLRLWGRILQSVPGSRLVLKAFGLDGATFTPRLSAAGIDPARVTLLGAESDIRAHLGAYRLVDIALDPFPYNGTTTTCEALYMGRPVIGMRGDRHAARVGASLLSAVGRTEWIAETADDYVRIASALAGDKAALVRESSALRQRLEASPVMDHQAQAARFARAVRDGWDLWCAQIDSDRASSQLLAAALG